MELVEFLISEPLVFPAWLVALAVAFFMGARAVVEIRSSGGDRAETPADGIIGIREAEWRTRVENLLRRQDETMGEVISALAHSRSATEELTRFIRRRSRALDQIDEIHGVIVRGEGGESL